MSYLNLLKAQIAFEEAREAAIRRSNKASIAESLVANENEIAVFLGRTNEMSYLVSNFNTFTPQPACVPSPAMTLARKYVYGYLKAKQLHQGREYIKYEAYMLFMNHDAAFDIIGDPNDVNRGNDVIPGSRTAFKSLINSATQTFYTENHANFQIIYENVAGVATAEEARETVRVLLERVDPVTPAEFGLLFTITCFFVCKQMKTELELSYMYCLIGLSKGTSVDGRFMQRKLASFKTQRTFDTSHFFDEFDEEAMHRLIDE